MEGLFWGLFLRLAFFICTFTSLLLICEVRLDCKVVKLEEQLIMLVGLS